MSSTPYHPHPDNAATFTDDSNGWETAQPRLTFARIAQLHARAQSDATIHVRLPIHTYGQHVSVQEDDIYALEFFKARIRLTHAAQPPGHSAKLTGPEATLGTIEHLRPYLLDGTALFGSAPIAVAITRPALLASQNPAGEIEAAIGWLRAFAMAVVPIPTRNTGTTAPSLPTPTNPDYNAQRS